MTHPTPQHQDHDDRPNPPPPPGLEVLALVITISELVDLFDRNWILGVFASLAAAILIGLTRHK